MSTHDPAGSSICIHAVCVSPEYRKRGVALGLLKEYISRMERARQSGVSYERIVLITHENMRGLYEKAGFEWVGKSDVVHGSEPWFEMRKLLSPAPPPTQTQSLPPGLWEALQRSSSRSVPSARLLPSFPRGIEDVCDPNNKYDLLCPRSGCGSIILKNGVASLVERESVQLEPAGIQSPLAPLPAPPAHTQWWRITPNAMAFENIGFSRAIVAQGMDVTLLALG